VPERLRVRLLRYAKNVEIRRKRKRREEELENEAASKGGEDWEKSYKHC
jgi:hypothetical protein